MPPKPNTQPAAPPPPDPIGETEKKAASARSLEEAASELYYSSRQIGIPLSREEARIRAKEIWVNPAVHQGPGRKDNPFEGLAPSRMPDAMKFMGDAAVGAAGMAGLGPVGMAAGAIVNPFLNRDQPFLSGQNVASALAGPLGKAGAALRAGRGALANLGISAAENTAAVAASRTANQLMGNEEANPNAVLEYGLAAGLPAAAAGLASSRLRATPATWFRKIEEMDPSKSGAGRQTPEKSAQVLLDVTREAHSFPPAAKAAEVYENVLNKVRKTEFQKLSAEQARAKAAKQAQEAQEALLDAERKKFNLRQEIGDQILDKKTEIDAAKAEILDLKAKEAEGAAFLRAQKAELKKKSLLGEATIDDHLEYLRQEEEYLNWLADAKLEEAEKQTGILEKGAKIRERGATSEFAASLPDPEYEKLSSKMKKASAEEAALTARERALRQRMESGEFDLAEAEKILEERLKRTPKHLNPLQMNEDTRAIWYRVAEEGPSGIIARALKQKNQKGALDLINLVEATQYRPELQTAVRANILQQMLAQPRNIVMGRGYDMPTLGNIKHIQELRSTIETLGPETINKIYGSGNAYKNLNNYLRYFEKAVSGMPKDPKSGAVLGAASFALGGFPILYRTGITPETVFGAAAATLPVYLHVQSPVLLNRFIRSEGTISKFLQKMADNPAVLTGNSLGSRTIMAILRKSSDKATIRQDGKETSFDLRNQ